MKLNREQIVKALENAIRLGKFYSYMTPKLSYEELRDALALIREIEDERDRLDLTLAGVMHFVDKWLDGEELEQDEVNRAITMREKTLQIVEKLTEENERLKATAVGFPKGTQFVAVGQRERATVVTRSQIDKIYTDGFKDGMRKMQERLKMFFGTYVLGYKIPITEALKAIDQIAKELLEEGSDET